MKRVVFYYGNRTGNLLCEIRDGQQRTRIIDPNKALELFEEINSTKFSTIKFSKDNLILKNDKFDVVLHDYEEFYRTGDMDIIPRVEKRVQDTLEREQALRYFGKQFKKFTNSTPGKLAIAGSLALLILNSTFSKDEVIKADGPDISTRPAIGTIDPTYNPNSAIILSGGPGEEVEVDLSAIDETLEAQAQAEDLAENYRANANPTTYIDASRLSQADVSKATRAFNKYHDKVESYAAKWGISPNLPMAILTQESAGIGTDNLMQIQFSSWEGQKITVYNYERQEYQTFLFSDTAKTTKDCTVITHQDLNNPKTNISIGIIILRYGMDQKITGNNVFLANLMFNQGIGNTRKIIEATSRATGIPVEAIINDPTNLEFLKYTDTSHMGDEFYVQNVARYLQFFSDGDKLEFRDEDLDNDLKSSTITYKTVDEEGTIGEESLDVSVRVRGK